jgi:hypothetical protein
MSAALLSVNSAHAESVPQILTVRVYDAVGLPAADAGGAQRAANGIFDGTGIRLRWRECGEVSDEGRADACADPLGPDEVIARLTSGVAFGSAAAFGYAVVDAGAQAGSIATIFADRVAAAASRLGINRATLIGRALAHEIGHLLLGTNSHGPSGLMRAWWPDADLRRGFGSGWRFSPRETERIALALAQRTGGIGGRGVQMVAAPRREPRG